MRVFITGATSGLGLAMAHWYASRGSQIGAVGRQQPVLDALSERYPGQIQGYPLDVRDRPALHAAAHQFLKAGPVDLVIASAGISVGTLTEAQEDFRVFEQIIDVNLLAMVATFEPFLDSMKARGAGQLAGIASVAGIRGLPGASAYSASKAAVIAYCESLRNELSGYGIRVCTLTPGYIRTPMTAHNPYSMPFLTDAEVFADRAARALARQRRQIVIPWQMGIIAKLLRVLPNAVFDYFARNAPRKPRQTVE